MCLVRDMRVTGPLSCERQRQGQGLLQGLVVGLSGTSPGRKLWSQWCLQDEAHKFAQL